MKIIQTWYKGILFRRRTEARWAVFFDSLGIDWDYEEEGFIMSDGTYYLPDFHLPTFDKGMFVEVKGVFTQSEKELCRDLCYESGKNVLLAEGIPKPRELKCVICNNQAKTYHHYKGYEKKNWLDILPLCYDCHFKEHIDE